MDLTGLRVHPSSTNTKEIDSCRTNFLRREANADQHPGFPTHSKRHSRRKCDGMRYRRPQRKHRCELGMSRQLLVLRLLGHRVIALNTTRNHCRDKIARDRGLVPRRDVVVRKTNRNASEEAGDGSLTCVR